MGRETRFVKPREGLLVRNPLTKAALPENGASVPWVGPEGRYYRKRLKQGDIELLEQVKKIEKMPIRETVKTNKFTKESETEVRENGN